ncbi:MAG: hypothetical protein U0W24_10135 [Bacteroidales bacterium]
MNSKQYNFFPSKTELQKFDDYLKSKGFIILSIPSPELPFKTKQNLLDNMENWPMCIITRTQYLDKIDPKFIEEQNYYTIDVITSHVIEILLPIGLNEFARPNRARIYFTTAYYNEKQEWIDKDAEFIKEADSVLIWCKRNFLEKY